MVSEELIVKNEILNDGGEMHLYYSRMYEAYVAYGYSAFVVIEALRPMVTEESYSEEMQMPMVKVNQEQVDMIKSKGLIVEDMIDEGYLHIRSFIPFDERKYHEWAGHLRDLNH